MIFHCPSLEEVPVGRTWLDRKMTKFTPFHQKNGRWTEVNWLNHGKPSRIAMKFTTKVGFQKWLGEAELGATLCQQNSKHWKALSEESAAVPWCCVKCCQPCGTTSKLTSFGDYQIHQLHQKSIKNPSNPSKNHQKSIKTPSFSRVLGMKIHQKSIHSMQRLPILPGTSPGRPSSSSHATASVDAEKLCSDHPNEIDIDCHLWGSMFHPNSTLLGGWATPLKNMSSSIGMMRFPQYEWENKKWQPNHQPVHVKC